MNCHAFPTLYVQGSQASALCECHCIRATAATFPVPAETHSRSASPVGVRISTITKRSPFPFPPTFDILSRPAAASCRRGFRRESRLGTPPPSPCHAHFCPMPYPGKVWLEPSGHLSRQLHHLAYLMTHPSRHGSPFPR